MLCEKCGKFNATTHIRRVVNGVVTEQNLCGYCAAEQGIGDMGSNSLAQMLASMLGSGTMLGSKSQTHCDCCGSTFSDVAESGKVGCPECYKTFYNELLPYLKRVHGSTKHIGKIPNHAPLTIRPQVDTVESLRLQLNQLVREENYEQAAIVRDKIRELEGEQK